MIVQNTYKKQKRLPALAWCAPYYFRLYRAKKTLTRMIVASYATPQNIEIMQGEANKSVDYLINKIVEAGEKWEQRGQSNG